jgi:hypothetical protein
MHNLNTKELRDNLKRVVEYLRQQGREDYASMVDQASAILVVVDHETQMKRFDERHRSRRENS